MHAELAEDIGHMGASSAVADEEGVADLLVALALHQQSQNLQLPGRKVVDGRAGLLAILPERERQGYRLGRGYRSRSLLRLAIRIIAKRRLDLRFYLFVP